MSDNNGEQKDESQETIRDSLGRFVPGVGGPGRGHRKPQERMTFDEIEGLLQRDLKDKDVKTRHNATKLLLMLRKQSGNTDSDKPIIDAMLQQAFSQHFGEYGEDDTDESEYFD